VKPLIKQELIKRALAEISKRYENYEYFFSKLESPTWVEPLYKEGRFKEPPPSVSDGKYIRFPFWPESQYLARMASKAPELVLKIALEIPDTDNIRVHEDIVDVALAIPPELSVQLLSRVIDWIESPHSLLLSEKVGKLVVHLTNGGKIKEAIDLANTLIDVLPDPQWEEKSKSESSFISIELHAWFDVWDYEQILINDMPILVKVAEEKALSLLCEKLDKAVRFSMCKSEQEKPEDHSYVWRDSIESDDNLYEGVRDLLVTAVRKAGEFLIEKKGKITLVTIEQYPYYIFKRIGLYLRRKYPTVDIEGTNKLVTDPNVFDNTALHHEYFHLLKEQFNNLSQETKDGYLALVENGEDMTWWISMREKADGKKPNQDEIDKRNQYWKYTKLIPIQEYLTGDWRKNFDEFKKEFPEPEHPDYHFYSGDGVRIGPTSPKN
jgi:hypothetical protein